MFAYKYSRGLAITDIKDTQVLRRFDLGTLHGAAITEIDSPPFPVRPPMTSPPAFPIRSRSGNGVGISLAASWVKGEP